MSEISEIYQFPAPASSDPYAAASKDEIMGKEEFLTLLVAQLQNQDPLNPDDPTEFTAQLAQFSSLEQLMNLNESLVELADAQIQSERYTSLDLIGKEVAYPGGSFQFNGSPVDVGYQLDGTASSVSISIRNEYGATVANLTPTGMEAGNHFVEWNGLDTEGNVAMDGKYSIVLQANAGGDESSIAISPLIRSKVTGIDLDTNTGEAILYTEAGEVRLNSILSAYSTDANPADNTNISLTNESFEETPSSSEIINEAAGTAASTVTAESALTDEEQLALDQLVHYLTGLN